MYHRKRNKTSKEKIIENVGLTKHLKSTETRNGHYTSS